MVTTKNGENMKLSNQALGAVMMALQQSLLTQTDCTEILRGFNLALDEEEQLLVLNPPTVKIDIPETTEVSATTGSD